MRTPILKSPDFWRGVRAGIGVGSIVGGALWVVIFTIAALWWFVGIGAGLMVLGALVARQSWLRR